MIWPLFAKFTMASAGGILCALTSNLVVWAPLAALFARLAKRNVWKSFAWAVILGPLAWLAIPFLDRTRLCPACDAAIREVDWQSARCRVCGSEMADEGDAWIRESAVVEERPAPSADSPRVPPPEIGDENPYRSPAAD